ncbi:hypothetical protein [Streptomyces sp. NBC_01006]|nr:hypothetical protein OG509_01770 [Streptomyces sp. NBC_01006]
MAVQLLLVRPAHSPCRGWGRGWMRRGGGTHRWSVPLLLTVLLAA